MEINQAVVMVDGSPHLELTANLIVPVQVGQSKFYIHFKPYTFKEAHDVLKKSAAKTVFEPGKTRVIPGNDEAYLPFFDTHFDGSTGFFEDEEKTMPCSADAVRDWLTDKANAKKIAFNNLFSIKLIRPERKDAPSLGMVISSVVNTRTEIKAEVKTAYLNGNPEPEDIQAPLVFNFTKESQADRIAFRRATEAREFDNESSEMTIPDNHAELCRLFDSLIESIEGATVSGKPCSAESKPSWLASIPYWYKAVTVRELFRDSRIKN